MIKKDSRNSALNRSISFLRYVPEIEWTEDFFPKYCVGATYIMSPEHSKKIFANFEATMKEKYVWLEDFYITGLLAGMSKIEYKDFSNQFKRGKPKRNANVLTCHVNKLKPQKWIKLWHYLFDGKKQKP